MEDKEIIGYSGLMGAVVLDCFISFIGLVMILSIADGFFNLVFLFAIIALEIYALRSVKKDLSWVYALGVIGLLRTLITLGQGSFSINGILLLVASIYVYSKNQEKVTPKELPKEESPESPQEDHHPE